MAVSESAIKPLARISALELLAQHFVYLACDRDLEAIRAYRERLMAEAAETTIKGFDPAMSTFVMAEYTITPANPRGRYAPGIGSLRHR